MFQSENQRNYYGYANSYTMEIEFDEWGGLWVDGEWIDPESVTAQCLGYDNVDCLDIIDPLEENGLYERYG